MIPHGFHSLYSYFTADTSTEMAIRVYRFCIHKTKKYLHSFVHFRLIYITIVTLIM